jgi:hypothetical protein
VEQSITWCVAQAGVDIISMSLGTLAGSDGLDPLSLSVNAAVDAGKIVVVAAGNSGDLPSSVGSPGAAEKAITVGAVAEWSADPSAPNHSAGTFLAPFSSRGPTLAPSSLTKPDIAAPGVSVISAAHNTGSGYAMASGTSMATPFTTGTVALMLDADPTLTTTAVASLLSTTAIDVGPVGKDNHWGWGLLDGYAVVAAASGDTEYEPTIFPRFETITGSVDAGGVWTHSFELTEDDLTTPIAATIILDGALVCIIDLGPFGCFQYEWVPDLEARFRDPSGTQLALSECPAFGDCGSAGQQETLHVMPTTPGDYVIEVFPVSGGGTFSVYLSAGVSGAIDVPDVEVPVVSVLSPSDWSSVPGPVTVEGPVSDDVGVAGVQVRVYDRDSGWHWDGAAFVDGPATDLVGVVDVVGSTSTDWSYVFDLGAVPPSIQAYNVSVRAFDAAGNYSDWERVNFYVTDVVPDTTLPVVSVVSPSDWSSVPGPVTVEGPVSDDVGVAGVQVRVYDRDSGWHWDGAAFVDGPATDLVGVVDVVGSTSTDWSYVFDLGAVPPSIQAYNVSVRAFDAAGNYSDWERVNFYVTDVVPDTTLPVVSVVSPSDWSSVPGPVTVEGPVSDDVGVAGVQVRVYDRDSGWHWDGAAFVDGPATDLVGVVDVVGSTSTDWSYVFDLGAVPPSIQAYNVSVRAFDAAGNYSDWERVNFYVTDVVPDTTLPVVSVVSPSDWSSVPGPVTVEGPVSDDVGVAGVQVRVYDRDSGWHWDGAAFVDGPATDLVGVVDVVGSTSTDWSYVFDLGLVPPSIQAYNVSVRAFDAAGNYSDWERVNFYVTEPVDEPHP